MLVESTFEHGGGPNLPLASRSEWTVGLSIGQLLVKGKTVSFPVVCTVPKFFIKPRITHGRNAFHIDKVFGGSVLVWFRFRFWRFDSTVPV